MAFFSASVLGLHRVAEVLSEVGHQAADIAREHGQLSDLVVRIGPHLLSLFLHVPDCESLTWGIQAGIRAFVIGLQ